MADPVADLIEERDKEIERLRLEVKARGQEIHALQEQLHKKNMDLDALHFIWCTGCKSGANRFSQNNLTRELVERAEHLVKRARTWIENVEFKEKWNTDPEFRRAWYLVNDPANWRQNPHSCRGEK